MRKEDVIKVITPVDHSPHSMRENKGSNIFFPSKVICKHIYQLLKFNIIATIINVNNIFIYILWLQNHCPS